MLIELTRDKYATIDVNDADLAGRSWHAVPGHVLLVTIRFMQLVAEVPDISPCTE